MRNIENEQDKILNGNRFTVNTSEVTGVFHRDVDKLMHQYKNLRYSVYNQFEAYLPDSTTKDELRSYIDEQFVRLVKEYDINGPVDFPGYIKTKLTYRVRHSYIKGEYRDRQRVFVPKNDFDVSNLIDKSPSMDEELDYYATLEYSLNGMEFSDVEKEILFYTLQELTASQIEKKVKKSHPKISASAIKEALNEVQLFLKTKLQESLKL